MLILKNINKSFYNGKKQQQILKNINLSFGNTGLIFIVGSSGSGKSTLLNIIAGNLKCDSGTVITPIGKLEEFNEKKLNYYRKNIIGNIFQDYNLIDYLNVYDNVNLNSINKNNINLILKKLEIYDKKNKKVNKLSGGEKQRVAIARTLSNKVPIILADEPTGALDSVNSNKIMQLLKKISSDRLVIVVSHDLELSKKYADRIIEIRDGVVANDKIYNKIDNLKKVNYGNSKIKNKILFKIVFKNLYIKFKRTFFTSLTISIGLISMIIVMCLAYNFNDEINNLEKDLVSYFPITVSNGKYEKNDEVINNSNKIKINDYNIHNNKITKDYIDFIDKINVKKVYKYDISMPFITDIGKIIDTKYLNIYSYELDNYNLIYGHMPNNKNEVLLLLDSNKTIDLELSSYLGFNNDIEYNNVIDKKIRIVINDDYYIKENGKYYINTDNKMLYKNSQIELTVVGVVYEKENISLNSSILYSEDLINDILNINKDSQIVLDQLNIDNNILGIDISKEEMLNYLGYNSLPNEINLYSSTIKEKEILLKKLDDYNENNVELIYIDSMSSVIDIVREFIEIISIILLIFSLISIIISALMIGILTSIRVIERKKDIGILRSIGVSGNKIKRMFNLENILILLISSIISIIFVLLFKNYINHMLYNLIEIDNLFRINYFLIGLVIVINMIIIYIAGLIPTVKASKMEIIDCIYNK